MKIRVDGLREVDRALGELSKSAARTVLRRAGMTALRPMAEMAARLAPRDTGELAGSITVSARADGADAGKAAFASVMRRGGSRSDAVQALREARESQDFVTVFAGPRKPDGAREAVKQIAMEFGSFKDAAQPYMRPAFDAEARPTVDRLKPLIMAEIERAMARAARAAARRAARA